MLPAPLRAQRCCLVGVGGHYLCTVQGPRFMYSMGSTVNLQNGVRGYRTLNFDKGCTEQGQEINVVDYGIKGQWLLYRMG